MFNRVCGVGRAKTSTENFRVKHLVTFKFKNECVLMNLVSIFLFEVET